MKAVPRRPSERGRTVRKMIATDYNVASSDCGDSETLKLAEVKTSIWISYSPIE